MSDETTVDETEAEIAEELVEKPKPRKRASKKAVAAEEPELEPAIGPVENVITAPQKAHTDGPVRSNITQTAEGVIGSVMAEKQAKKEPVAAPAAPEVEKVALWSDKNIRWSGVGTLVKGYNIVTKEVAEKWQARPGVREATPEEVAAHYSK